MSSPDRGHTEPMKRRARTPGRSGVAPHSSCSSARWCSSTPCSSRRSPRSCPTTSTASGSPRPRPASWWRRTPSGRSWAPSPAACSPAGSGCDPAVLVGLAAMSVASLVFGYAPLAGAARRGPLRPGRRRRLHLGGRPGLAGAAATTDRRGAALGTAFAAAVGGALLGPVIGAVASHVGTGPAFAAATVAGGILMVASLLVPKPQRRPPPDPAQRAAGHRRTRHRRRDVADVPGRPGARRGRRAGPAAPQPARRRRRGHRRGLPGRRPRWRSCCRRWSAGCRTGGGRMTPVRLSLVAAIVVSVLAPVAAPADRCSWSCSSSASRLRDPVRARPRP